MKKHRKSSSSTINDEEPTDQEETAEEPIIPHKKKVKKSLKRNSAGSVLSIVEEPKKPKRRKNQVAPIEPITSTTNIDPPENSEPKAFLRKNTSDNAKTSESKSSSSSSSNYSYSSSIGGSITSIPDIPKSKHSIAEKITSFPDVPKPNYKKGKYDLEIERRIKEREEMLKNSQMTRHIREDEYNERKLLEETELEYENKKKMKQLAEENKNRLSMKPEQNASQKSTVSFAKMSHKSGTSYDKELKKGLMTESAMTTEYNRDDRTLMEACKIYEQQLYVDYVINQKDIADISDTDNELLFCPSKERQRLKYYEDSILAKDKIYHTWLAQQSSWEQWMRLVQRWVKWLVVAVGLMDFCFAVEYSYQIISKQMKYEFFFLEGVFNCDRLISEWYLIGLWSHVIHGCSSVILLWMENKKTAPLGLLWIGTQIYLWIILSIEFFIKVRFLENPVLQLIKTVGWSWFIDLAQVFIVGFRYWKVSRVMDSRLHKIAHENRVNVKKPTINDELLLLNSRLLQHKDLTRRRVLEQNREVFEYMDAYSYKYGKLPNKIVLNKEISKFLENISYSDTDWDQIRLKLRMGDDWYKEYEKAKKKADKEDAEAKAMENDKDNPKHKKKKHDHGENQNNHTSVNIDGTATDTVDEGDEADNEEEQEAQAQSQPVVDISGQRANEINEYIKFV